jgi:hypothetical protein
VKGESLDAQKNVLKYGQPQDTGREKEGFLPVERDKGGDQKPQGHEDDERKEVGRVAQIHAVTIDEGVVRYAL